MKLPTIKSQFLYVMCLAVIGALIWFLASRMDLQNHVEKDPDLDQDCTLIAATVDYIEPWVYSGENLVKYSQVGQFFMLKRILSEYNSNSPIGLILYDPVRGRDNKNHGIQWLVTPQPMRLGTDSALQQFENRVPDLLPKLQQNFSFEIDASYYTKTLAWISDYFSNFALRRGVICRRLDIYFLGPAGFQGFVGAEYASFVNQASRFCPLTTGINLVETQKTLIQGDSLELSSGLMNIQIINLEERNERLSNSEHLLLVDVSGSVNKSMYNTAWLTSIFRDYIKPAFLSRLPHLSTHAMDVSLFGEDIVPARELSMREEIITPSLTSSLIEKAKPAHTNVRKAIDYAADHTKYKTVWLASDCEHDPESPEDTMNISEKKRRALSDRYLFLQVFPSRKPNPRNVAAVEEYATYKGFHVIRINDAPPAEAMKNCKGWSQPTNNPFE